MTIASHSNAKIAVIGECMIELSQKGADLSRGFGGDTLNTSVYLSRQVPENELAVHFVNYFGTDSFSNELFVDLERDGV